MMHPQDTKKPGSDFGIFNDLYGIAMAAGIPDDVAMQVVDYTIGVIRYRDHEDWVDPHGWTHCTVRGESDAEREADDGVQ
jgi:hypothetical protein